MKTFTIEWVGWRDKDPAPKDSIYMGQTEEARVSDGERWAVKTPGADRQEFIQEVAEFVRKPGYEAC